MSFEQMRNALAADRAVAPRFTPSSVDSVSADGTISSDARGDGVVSPCRQLGVIDVAPGDPMYQLSVGRHGSDTFGFGGYSIATT